MKTQKKIAAGLMALCMMAGAIGINVYAQATIDDPEQKIGDTLKAEMNSGTESYYVMLYVNCPDELRKIGDRYSNQISANNQEYLNLEIKLKEDVDRAATRFANGEITEDEYLKVKEDVSAQLEAASAEGNKENYQLQKDFIALVQQDMESRLESWKVEDASALQLAAGLTMHNDYNVIFYATAEQIEAIIQDSDVASIDVFAAKPTEQPTESQEAVDYTNLYQIMSQSISDVALAPGQSYPFSFGFQGINGITFKVGETTYVQYPEESPSVYSSVEWTVKQGSESSLWFTYKVTASGEAEGDFIPSVPKELQICAVTAQGEEIPILGSGPRITIYLKTEDETEPTTEATEPTTETTEPVTEPTEPTTETTEPVTDATEPATEATEPTTESTEVPSVYGDFNHDGKVNASDAAVILIYAAEYGAGSFTGTFEEYVNR